MKGNKKNTPSSKKEKEKDFPGYPHYKQEEDILSRSSEEGRIEMNLDDVGKQISPLEIPKSANKSQSGVKGERRGRRSIKSKKAKDENEFVPGNDADVTEEELEALSNEGVKRDKIFKPSDLDIPGAELDDDLEDLGSEDEENNYYSLGGDDKENLEENQGDQY